MPGGIWSDFSYVASSGYREKVILSLAERPRLPKQLAEETKVRIVHVSRALQELKGRGLVECLTPTAKRRGRLYGLTPQGHNLFTYMTGGSYRFSPSPVEVTEVPKFAFKSRASAISRCIKYLKKTKGEDALEQALTGWGIDADLIREDDWLPVQLFAEFLDRVEARFGDGTYDFVRELMTEVIATIPTIKEQILKVIPLEALAERAPIVYHKEFNYGRLEVRTGHRRASFLHFDWMPTLGMCAMFQGAYQGILRARGVKGEVREVRCVRAGDDHCEYLVEW